jgi:hypothetical protein
VYTSVGVHKFDGCADRSQNYTEASTWRLQLSSLPLDLRVVVVRRSCIDKRGVGKFRADPGAKLYGTNRTTLSVAKIQEAGVVQTNTYKADDDCHAAGNLEWRNLKWELEMMRELLVKAL